MLFSRRRNPLAIASLTLYAATLVVGVTWFVLNQIRRAEVEDAQRAAALAIANAQRYTGTVVIPVRTTGECRRLAFDNVTGALRERATGSCNDDAVDINSTQGRISAIRDSFAKH